MKEYSKLNQIEEGLSPAAVEESVPISEVSVGDIAEEHQPTKANTYKRDPSTPKEKPDSLHEKRKSLEIDQQQMPAAYTGTYERSDNADSPSPPPPPPGVRPGGMWGTSTHFGERTTYSSVICCLIGGCIPVCIHSCLPFDKRRVYKSVNGIVYDAKGNSIGHVRNVNFDEGAELDDPIDQDQRMIAYIFSGFVIFVILLFNILRLALDDNQY